MVWRQWEHTWTGKETELDVVRRPQGELWKGEVGSWTKAIWVDQLAWNLLFGPRNNIAYIHAGKLSLCTKKKVAWPMLSNGNRLAITQSRKNCIKEQQLDDPRQCWTPRLNPALLTHVQTCILQENLRKNTPLIYSLYLLWKIQV